MKKLALALATPLLLMGLAGPAAWASDPIVPVDQPDALDAMRSEPERSGGIPWWYWLVGGVGSVVLLTVAGAAMGKRQTLDTLRSRLEALRGPRERILAGADKLSDVSTLSRFQDSDVQAAYQKLAKSGTRVTAQARAFGDRYEAACEEVELSRDLDASARLIDALEREAVILEAEVAGAVAALENLEDGEITADDLAGVDMPERMREAARALLDLRAERQQLSERASALAVATDIRAASALDAAHSALTGQPADAEAVEKLLEEARQCLAGYKAEVKEAEEHQRQAEARRALEADRAAARAAWAAATAPKPHPGSSTYRPSYRSSSSDSSSSSSSSGGSSADSSWGDSGSSADSSWGSSSEDDKNSGGSSGGGSW